MHLPLAAQPAPTTVYKMANGMDVILKENHSSPMIASIVFVRSGSKYETDFNNGATHFLEHLLFNGTATRTQEQISDRIKNLGGYINAFTRKEVTGYLSLVPREHIGEALDIQQDMLFNSIFPEDRFPKERKIVIEEIRKDSDSPDYIAELFHDRWAYQGSPYARPVLGYENLISTLPRDDVIDYYHAFYQPNNMILLLIGDFATDALKKELDQTFGQHPARPLPSRPAVTVPEITSAVTQRTTAEIGETRIDVHLRLPSYRDPSYAALSLWSELLNDEAFSPLVQNLTKGEDALATRVSVSMETQEEFSAYRISAATDDAGHADKILSEVLTTVRGLSTAPIRADDIQTIATRLRVADIFLREKLHYYAIMKAPMLAVTGYEFVDQLAERVAQATPQQLQKAASQHLRAEAYVATIVKPPDTMASSGGAATPESRTHYLKRTLANGMNVVIKSNPDSRVYAINVLGRNRSALEADGQEGISDFVNRMLVAGTSSRTSEQISRDLASIGAELTTNDNPYIPYDDHYTTPQHAFVKFATIDDYASQGASLVADLIASSSFPPNEVENERRSVMGILGMASGSTNQVCRELFNRAMFGSAPYSKPITGSMASVPQFTSEMLQAHRAKLYAPGNIILTCVTGMPADSALAIIEKSFGAMTGASATPVTIAIPATPTTVQAEHKAMQKEQVYIYLGNAIAGAASPDIEALMVANSILSSRLGGELREKQGLAYSVGSSVQFDRDFGWFTCKMGTGKANYQKARDGILEQIRRVRAEPVTQEELETAQNTLWGSSLTSRLSRVNQAFYMGVDEFLGLGYDYSDRMVEGIRAVTIADVQRVAKQYFHADSYVMATAGELE
jgi:zinc protease